MKSNVLSIDEGNFQASLIENLHCKMHIVFYFIHQTNHNVLALINNDGGSKLKQTIAL